MNYSEMSNTELDNLAAEMILKWTRGGANAKGVFWWRTETGNPKLPIDGIMLSNDWKPTHPDSNQADVYLFPKFYGLIWRVHECKSSQGFRVTIKNHSKGILVDVIDKSLNRCRVIACLEAWDKIK